jgi:hypothetical protein
MKKQNIPELNIFQNKIHTRFVQWVARKFGYEILMVKVKSDKNVISSVDGNFKMFKYFDTTGFLFNLEPLSRTVKAEPKPKDNLPNKLSKEQLEELGIK